MRLRRKPTGSEDIKIDEVIQKSPRVQIEKVERNKNKDLRFGSESSSSGVNSYCESIDSSQSSEMMVGGSLSETDSPQSGMSS